MAKSSHTGSQSRTFCESSGKSDFREQGSAARTTNTMDGHPIIKDRTGGSVQHSARQLAASEVSGCSLLLSDAGNPYGELLETDGSD